MKPGKLQRNKQRSQDLFWKVHDRVLSFIFHSHTLAEFFAVTFLLDSSLDTNRCVLCKVRAKKPNKNIEQAVLQSFLKLPRAINYDLL